MNGPIDGPRIGGASTPDGASGEVELADPMRLRALAQLGLTARSDPEMEQFAQWVRDTLQVPVALVSLVTPQEQVFPGMVGLGGPWAARRSTPLTHSFCRHVVRSGQPLVVADAREEPLVRDNLAVPDLDVLAYAGMPLTDDDGHVLGSLCAIDRRPRAWTVEELRSLKRIAWACSVAVRLRLSRFDHDVEGLGREALELVQQRDRLRSQTLLLAAQQFTDTTTVEDVVARIAGLVSSALSPAAISTVLLEGGRLRRLDGLDARGTLVDFSVEDQVPSARAIRERRLIHYPDRASLAAENSGEAADLFGRLDLQTLVAVPLPGPDGPLGAMVLGWSHPAAVDAADLVTLASIADYAGRAFNRADQLRYRVFVAHELQKAMLTTLPLIAGLEMAARYQPADSREHVGGDWFDAATLPNTEHSGHRAVAVSVGDIVGHNLDAVTVMGQVRSMLRQAAWDHPGGPPADIVRAFEHANLGLSLCATGTMVIAHLHDHADGTWSMTWTSAGHPPPILITPDGGVELLEEHDALFGFPAVSRLPRHDHTHDLPMGATLVLYTDGLVEHRRHPDIDAGIDDLTELLRRIHRRPVQDIVDTIVDTLAADAADDVVAFAIRLCPSPG